MAESTSVKTVRVGIVGIGFGQQVMVPAFRMSPGYEVRAICASAADRASAVAGRLGIEQAFGRWTDMVEDPQIEAIAIATPAALQPAIAIAAMRQGKSVFCEKPIASSIEAGRAMWQAAQESKVAHMVDFEFPEIDQWQRAKAILDQGGIGRLRYANFSWNIESYAYKSGLADSWKTDSGSGGGALNTFASHLFYHLEWFLGPIRRLSCKLARSPNDQREADSIVLLSLVMESGVSVSASVCCCAFLGSGHRLEFYGDDGTMMLINDGTDHAGGFRFLYGTRASGQLAVQPSSNRTGSDAPDGRIELVSRLAGRFLAWMTNGTPAVPSLKQGFRVQQLLEAARQSEASGAWIDDCRSSR